MENYSQYANEKVKTNLVLNPCLVANAYTASIHVVASQNESKPQRWTEQKQNSLKTERDENTK